MGSSNSTPTSSTPRRGGGGDRNWVGIEPGIDQITLNEDPTFFRPQDEFARDYVEDIFIVEGARRGGRCGAGAYAYRKSGIEHGPFYTEKGCLMFIVPDEA
ncbi:Uu.00g097730.m01.CDS01 [Anthostomella pinea]|uniref:Uu.00g097730.m01.CDS01 n=1 Tax=Anthostomella pinea TaxID=933095 RepID=A0AAI8YCN4_9PEZI|nr:Uu.00g097730.m01.CDS01 [Anthostomella pinea]